MSLLIALAAALTLGIWISRRSDAVWRTAPTHVRRYR